MHCLGCRAEEEEEAGWWQRKCLVMGPNRSVDLCAQSHSCRKRGTEKGKGKCVTSDLPSNLFTSSLLRHGCPSSLVSADEASLAVVAADPS